MHREKLNCRGCVILGVLLSLGLCVNSFAAYCSASGGDDEYINSFNLYIYHNQGTGYYPTGYDNRTAAIIDLQRGQSYQFLIINGKLYTGDQCRIWIDWNKDEVFNTSGSEVIVPSGGPQYFYGTISVPADAPLGQTRLRVRLSYTGSMLPCGTTTYGEVEDYTINVTPAGSVQTIYASATMGPMNQSTGYGFDDVQYLAARFELTEPTQITVVGGHIFDYSTTEHPLVNFYIVELSGPGGFPNYNIFPAWGVTTGLGPKVSMDYRLPISIPVVLDPGWYAIIVGYDDDFPGVGLMPTDGQTRIGSPSYMVRTTTSWLNFYPLYAPRFVVEGIVLPGCEEPNSVINPVPWDGLSGIPVDVNLHWSQQPDACCPADRFDVYLDTVNPPTALLGSNITDSCCTASDLPAGTDYYWQVIAKNDSGQTAGPVWSFQTDDMTGPPELLRYYIIDLGVMEEAYYSGIPISSSNAYALNELLSVVGSAEESMTANYDHTFFWRDVNGNHQSDPNEMIRAEDLRETGYNYAYDISNNGLVVGVVGSGALDNQAFRWLDQNGNFIVDAGEAQYLPLPPPPLLLHKSSIANGCNDNLMAVGKCDVDVNGTGRVRACVWDISENTYTVLGTLGGTESYANAISDSNYVVGMSNCTDSNLRHGFIWVDGDADGSWRASEMVDIPTFGGKYSSLNDVSEKGHVVGYARDAAQKSHAFIWIDSNGNGRCETGEMTNIETGSAALSSLATALNDYDQVVGQVQYYSSVRRAFYWDKNTGMIDLFKLVCNKEDWDYLYLANDISNNGCIVGQGRKLNGGYHAFLMIPELSNGDLNCDSTVNFPDFAELADQWLLTKQETDIYPGGGDGIANLKDYAILAYAWKGEYPLWPYDDIVDFTHDNVIDMNDFAVLADEYLQPGCYSADVAPLPDGDDIVDLEDLAVIAQHWLEVQP